MPSINVEDRTRFHLQGHYLKNCVFGLGMLVLLIDSCGKLLFY